MRPENGRRSHLTELGKSAIRAQTTPDGRYIPHSGGLMGWFENSGVAKHEKSNNYRFHEAIDAESVRSKLFERWSEGENINRRTSERVEVTRNVDAQIVSGEANYKAEIKDCSPQGLRVQILEPELPLKKGDLVTSRITTRFHGSDELFEIDSVVMRASRTGKQRAVWTLGIMFQNLPAQQAEKLMRGLA